MREGGAVAKAGRSEKRSKGDGGTGPSWKLRLGTVQLAAVPEQGTSPNCERSHNRTRPIRCTRDDKQNMSTNASIQTPQHNTVEVCSARMQNRPTLSADRRSWRSIGRPPWPFARRWCCRNRHGSLTLSKRRFQAGARHAAAHEFTRDGHSPPQITNPPSISTLGQW